MRNLLTILAGAILLAWPAILNGYPILYSDTGGFLEQALMPDMGWDKPWIYGPFLTPFHWRIILWPAMAGQAVILSAALWLTQCVLVPPRRTVHLVVCATLAVGSAAPWFASLLMPDILAPVTALGLLILAQGPGRMHPATLAAVALVTTIAIASHLAHLVLAAACIVVLCTLTWRILWRPAAPLAAALALLLASNIVGNGTAAISPFGATFLLARLVADGPARTTIQRACPEAAWRLCAWKDRLPTDSDDFLWDGNGPVWAYGYGPIRIAPEAAIIVRATILSEPVAIARAFARNTVTQLGMTAIGDALIPDHLEIAVRERIVTYFPQAEAARFDASLQIQGRLPAIAARFHTLHAALLVLGALATTAIALTQWRRDRPLAIFAAMVLAACLANAFSTGALSGPHDRYQARIAWLVLLPPLFALFRERPAALPRPPPAAA